MSDASSDGSGRGSASDSGQSPGAHLRSEVDAVIAADDPEELLGAIIDIALASDDLDWAMARLTALSKHANTDVRGNALIGLSHLAGRVAPPARASIVATLRAGLEDARPYVREQAEAALDELGEALDER